MFNSLTKLANKEYSPILNEIYTGIEVFLYNLDETIFEIDYEYVFVKNKKIATAFLNQRCNEDLVLDLLLKLEKLYGLNIQKIQLKYSLKDKEFELSKYTDLKYDEIEILDFNNVSKEDFINQWVEKIDIKSKIG